MSDAPAGQPAPERVSLATIAAEWGRIGVTGFGGPPAHITLLRRLCVTRRGWLSPAEFEDGIAATSLLPGPASTQLAIFCGWRVRGAAGAVVGGLCFIVPGLVVIVALSALFLARHPPRLVEAAAAGAGAAVPVVALQAAVLLIPPSWGRVPGPAGRLSPPRVRWLCYAGLGALVAATLGPFLVVVLLGCGLGEMLTRHPPESLWRNGVPVLALPGPLGLAGIGGLGALAWVSLKVGALSYGGGFVIIPLMQHDAVVTYRWMSATQFLGAVALGQVTPGPVVLTVAVVGFAAAGVAGALLAAAVAFAPSFGFVLGGASRFSALRRNDRVQAFLAGAGPAAIGAIAGAAIPLAFGLRHAWQLGVLVVAGFWLLGARRSVVSALVGAGSLGVVAALLGAPIGR